MEDVGPRDQPSRLTRVMAYLFLAPAILVAILHLPRVEMSRDPVSEVALRPIAAAPAGSGNSVRMDSGNSGRSRGRRRSPR